ncbi:mitogen-activated protein kinase kinase 2 isoform X1 [Manihot esculenta]|uniref:Uncharacterized protein n=3 Tax=Manihot esculenta TaxID=3983 RepID=A0ACB7H1H0_MANES|nr:mitogen-activated protein kinase kinase 2 isoform X1 [Manihot esculenta]KAG8645950.1 hypothetical protein MANES_10G112700v8 [Manihot esculenta]KAG8645954.1 hypothetical protein MANES_10G112700v8 [Manihot esculenta]OAY39657.1 hypothetical protein MANES_10G112700v8 [Manihot esculenta]
MKTNGKGAALNGRKADLQLSLPSSPHGVSIADFLTESGTFVDGDLRVNRDGIRIVSQTETKAAAPIKPSDHQLSLADLEAIKVIGKGSSGIVQLVRHKWTEQFFALKVIQLRIEEKARKAIARELRINLTSQCPYVVKFYDSFYNNGDISTVLEYMDGGSLAEFLKRNTRIAEPYLAAICKQVLQGLSYLHHEKHIIHRDLKPSNILINHKGEVKIADFGVSAIMASTSGQANTYVGTYHYMSPERISSEISEGSHDYKSDIWSMGIVMLECATGQFPYSSPDQGEVWANLFELMEAIVEQPEPCAPSDQFSSEFCSFISSCLQKDPKKRRSTSELLTHAFMNKYDYLQVDLSSYFTNEVSQETSGK